MVDKVLLYVSAALDLLEERDMISRAVAEIPTTLGWRIVQSPARGQPAHLEAVNRADVHILLFASDIRAPIGIEWVISRRSGRNPELFLKDGVSRTLAASEFLHYMEDYGAVWHSFKDSKDLRMQTLQFLSDQLIRRNAYYSITEKEQAQLESWRKDLETTEPKHFEDIRARTGEDSLIISVDRYIPSEGVLIQPPKEKGYKKYESGPGK